MCLKHSGLMVKCFASKGLPKSIACVGDSGSAREFDRGTRPGGAIKKSEFLKGKENKNHSSWQCCCGVLIDTHLMSRM